MHISYKTCCAGLVMNTFATSSVQGTCQLSIHGWQCWCGQGHIWTKSPMLKRKNDVLLFHPRSRKQDQCSRRNINPLLQHYPHSRCHDGEQNILFNTTSHHIQFTTTEMIPDSKATTLFESVTHVVQLYDARGFWVTHMLMDGEFKSNQSNLLKLNIFLNVCSKSKYITEMERMIRTIKERTRGIYNTLPFEKMPGWMIVEMVYAAVFWLNTFHLAQDLLLHLNPRTIITGLALDFSRHCKHEFGSNV